MRTGNPNVASTAPSRENAPASSSIVRAVQVTVFEVEASMKGVSVPETGTGVAVVARFATRSYALEIVA